MNPRERTIAALELRQPDEVPHFELEMQLYEEYFGKRLTTFEERGATAAQRTRQMRSDAQLLVQTADHFGYGLIHYYPWAWRCDFEDHCEGIRQLAEASAGRHLITTHGDSTVSIPGGKDMDAVIVNMMMNPDAVKEEQDRFADDRLEKAVRLKACGLEGFNLCSDYCFNSGPFISPSMFSELVTPYLTKLVQGYRSLGLYVIKHTDGNIMPIIDDLVQAGPHALHSLDPMAGVDIRLVKQRYGSRVCLIGNVNCALMQTGTDEEVLASCRYAMENGRTGGGYIFSTRNVIFKGRPRERYELMLDYHRKNAAYN
jgi:uroporphyrinogen decarboxylase